MYGAMQLKCLARFYRNVFSWMHPHSVPHLLYQVGDFLLMDGLRGFAFRAWRVQDDDCLPLDCVGVARCG